MRCINCSKQAHSILEHGMLHSPSRRWEDGGFGIVNSLSEAQIRSPVRPHLERLVDVLGMRLPKDRCESAGMQQFCLSSTSVNNLSLLWMCRLCGGTRA